MNYPLASIKKDLANLDKVVEYLTGLGVEVTNVRPWRDRNSVGYAVDANWHESDFGSVPAVPAAHAVEVDGVSRTHVEPLTDYALFVESIG